MAATVVPHWTAIPLNVSPHCTVIVLEQPDQAAALPVDAMDVTRMVTTTKICIILRVIALSLCYFAE
jgi:hypothetical protein